MGATAVPRPTDSTGPLANPGYLDQMDFVSISGTLQGGEAGGMLQSMPPDWPKNCRFGIFVPEASMQEYAIEFTVGVPTKAMYTGQEWGWFLENRLFIRLEPDGENFLGPITVYGTWMPWEGAPAEPLIAFSGADTVAVSVTHDVALNRYYLEFDVDHFSDWEVCPEPLP